MVLVVIAWLYVVVMVAVVEAASREGTVLGGVFTFVLYGVLPLAILGYLYFSPARRRMRRTSDAVSADATGFDPDRGDHAPGDAIASVRIEP